MAYYRGFKFWFVVCDFGGECDTMALLDSARHLKQYRNIPTVRRAILYSGRIKFKAGA